jgi:hypothetical protein
MSGYGGRSGASLRSSCATIDEAPGTHESGFGADISQLLAEIPGFRRFLATDSTGFRSANR